MMKNFLRLSIMFFAGVCLLAGCQRDPNTRGDSDDTDKLPRVNVRIKLQVSPEVQVDVESGEIINPDIPLSASTRASGIISEDSINNIWCFQFDGVGDNAKLAGAPYYADEEKVAEMYADPNGVLVLPLIESFGATHRVVFIANTNDRYFNWNLQPKVSTYADLRSRGRSVLSEDEIIGAGVYGATGHQNLMMVGTSLTPVQPEIIINGTSGASPTAYTPGVPMYRSLAKITLNLTLAPVMADMKIVALMVNNVPTRIPILDGLGAVNVATFPLNTQTIMMGYDTNVSIDSAQTVADGMRTYSFYMPSNSRGKSSNSFTKQSKNFFAPALGTNYTFVGIDTVNYVCALYTIYPGMNDYNDFNLYPNHNYIQNFTVVGYGGDVAVDSRIVGGNASNYRHLDGQSNSFIVHPHDIVRAPIDQVNRYWSGTSTGYGNTPANVIGANDYWVVDLLWQDSPNIIRKGFIFGSYGIASRGAGISRGPNGYYHIMIPSDEQGNFVVALRKSDSSGNATSDVLWSWHFWVTDYDPDAGVAQYKESIDGHTFVYPCPGGQVERYGGTMWGYNSSGASAANNWNNYTYATTTPSNTVPYAKSFMMDRYYGQKSPTNVTNTVNYQAGRKDPLSLATTLYDIGGGIIGTSTANFAAQKWGAAKFATGGISISTSVKNPMTIYSDDWVTISVSNNIWLDTRLTYTDKMVKSIYDPCPLGWMMPDRLVAEDFRVATITGSNYKPVGYTINPIYWANAAQGYWGGSVSSNFWVWSANCIQYNGGIAGSSMTSLISGFGTGDRRSGVAALIRCISMPQ